MPLSTAIQSKEAPSSQRMISFRLIALVIMPALVLGAIELTLRVSPWNDALGPERF